ncbi:hypothetical protein NQZ68_003542 [Dissostichus eleginoides]|nr:hypothetical protein NQZ68_003542 [Dissostichus eleginoides]
MAKQYDVVAHLQFGRTPAGQGGTPAPRAGRADRLLRPQRQDQTRPGSSRDPRADRVRRGLLTGKTCLPPIEQISLDDASLRNTSRDS